MNPIREIPRLVAAVTASAIVGACSSASIPRSGAAVGVAGLGSPLTSSTVLYVDEYQNPGVFGYHGLDKRNKPAFCSTPGNTNYQHGMAVDDDGNLYVAGELPNNIYVFAPNCGQETTVPDKYGRPFSLALHGDMWYVASISSDGNSSDVIAVCSLSGCNKKLTPPGIGMDDILGVAVDSAGNVYGSGYEFDRIDPALVEFPHGKMPGKYIKNWHRDASSLEFDNDGNLVVVNMVSGPAYVYSGCPKACVSHGPFRLQHGTPFWGRLNVSNSKLVIPDAGGTVDVYAYHGTSGITYIYSISNGLTGAPSMGPVGAVIYPPAKP